MPIEWKATDKATKNPRKKQGGMIKNSELSRVARLLNEFLMLQLGAKTAHFFLSCWMLAHEEASEIEPRALPGRT